MYKELVIVINVGPLSVHIDKYLKSVGVESYYEVRDCIIDSIFRTILENEFGYKIVNNYSKYSKYVKLWQDLIWEKIYIITSHLDIRKSYHLRTLIVRNKIYLKIEEV